MKNTKYFISLLFIAFCLLITNTAHAYTFNQDLTVGSTGVDVYELQKFLNTYSEYTVISSSGTGSPGNETYYFGELTRQAVKRLQDNNFDQILRPAGLSSGTGYFGKSTRDFVNKYNNTPVNSTMTTNQAPNLKSQTSNKSETDAPEDYFVISNRTIKNGGKVHVGSTIPISNVDFFIDGEKLRKTCPITKKEKYACTLHINISSTGNKNITTNNSALKPVKIKILDESELTPEILGLEKIKLGEKQTIAGNQLTKNIKVYTLFGQYSVTTNKNSFKLKIDKPKNWNKTSEKGIFYVENSNGITSDIIIVDYEI